MNSGRGGAGMIDDDITLKKLQVFIAFITLGNMSLASNELGPSIVSVHRALHSLEEALRCPLFERSGRKLIPLASALVLAEHVKLGIGRRGAGRVDRGGSRQTDRCETD